LHRKVDGATEREAGEKGGEGEEKNKLVFAKAFR